MAGELGRRRADDGIGAVFCSDLARAAETAAIAFGATGIPVLLDWRLRECDYGRDNGMPSGELQAGRRDHLDRAVSGRGELAAGGGPGGPVPGRPAAALGRRSGSLVIGHVATRWGLDHHLNGVALETLVAEEFAWQPGWEYRLS